MARELKLVYKVHALNTALGLCEPMPSGNFFKYEEDAVAYAERLVHEGRLRSAVVYKAHVVVETHHPPLRYSRVGEQGELLD